MDSFIFPEPLWAGTDHSLAVATNYYKKASILASSMFEETEEEGVPYSLSVQDGVGIISVSGSLVNSDSWINRFFGVTSYAEIRRAAMHAMTNPDIKAVLLDIKSGGGAVNGVDETASTLKSLGKIKPVYAFTDDVMASAAYWLGATAKKVYAARTAITGSIGVIVTHMEISKMLEENGINVTVMRSGKYKALVNNVEPLSDIAQKQIMDQLMAADDIFISHVAEERGVPVETAREKMGQGREFFGQAGVDAGLLDGVRTFDGVMAEIRRKELDKSPAHGSNVPNLYQVSPMPRKALTQQQLALLQATGYFAADELALLQASVDAPPAPTPAPTPAPVPAQPVQPTSVPPAPTPVTPAPAADAVVTLLQAQLKSAQDSEVALKVELAQAQGKVSQLETSHAPLLKIAAQSVSNMRCALGLAAVNTETMTSEALLAEHAATAAIYADKFKVGGVAAVSPPPDTENKAYTPDPLREARLASTRFTSATH